MKEAEINFGISSDPDEGLDFLSDSEIQHNIEKACSSAICELTNEDFEFSCLTQTEANILGDYTKRQSQTEENNRKKRISL